MFKMIQRPADCEIRSVIRFLNARNLKAADIHPQICEVCGENVMSDGMACADRGISLRWCICSLYV
jgi:hypothetical protein